MSRWREMMMDYGQIFGSDKSAASSNVFSINSDLKDKRNSDLQLRRTLEVHFRPLFQRFVYGGEKIACHDLRRLLHDPEYRDRLPADKIAELADVADFNKGKAISYTEFCNIVLNQLPLDDLASQGSLDDLSTQIGLDRPQGTSGVRSALVVVCTNTTAQPMVQEKMTSYRCLPPPFFMILITLAQIITFIVWNHAEDVKSEPFQGIPPDNVIMYMPNRRREVWRWFTYFLLHQGYVDLIFNVVLQVFLGIPLEMMFSWWRIAIVYASGVIVGSGIHSIFDHYTCLVGASGGSAAIVGAHLMVLFINRKSLNNNPIESRTKKVCCSVLLRVIVLLLVVLSQLGLAIYRRWFIDSILIKIGIAANIGGLIGGAAMGDAFLTDYNKSPMKRCAALISMCTLFFFVGLTVVINITWEDYPLEDYS